MSACGATPALLKIYSGRQGRFFNLRPKLRLIRGPNDPSNYSGLGVLEGMEHTSLFLHSCVYKSAELSYPKKANASGQLYRTIHVHALLKHAQVKNSHAGSAGAQHLGTSQGWFHYPPAKPESEPIVTY